MSIDQHLSSGTAPDVVSSAVKDGSTGRLLAVGGILAALASTSCCILPLALFTLGASGAWIGNLTALAPYQPYFIVATLGFLGGGFWMIYRKPKAQTCEVGSYCASPASNRVAKLGLWTATIIVLSALAFPFVFKLFVPA